MDAKLQRRVQRYGWDLASHDYDCLSQEQLAPARNGMRELSALEPGQTVREASRRMHHLNPADCPVTFDFGAVLTNPESRHARAGKMVRCLSLQSCTPACI
jgi:hypothetical protein